ncbi:MAG TPA: hypothetical protein VFP65_16740 [Anaeromyxobacteraceae bacterium]|nr:hypothetical protein [Anaeromyxobacteraceae bacterium]
MSDTNSRKVSPANLLGRLVESVPAQYRQEVTRVASRIRDRLPPIMIEHRIDALERHVDERLTRLESKVDEILNRLEKR